MVFMALLTLAMLVLWQDLSFFAKMNKRDRATNDPDEQIRQFAQEQLQSRFDQAK